MSLVIDALPLLALEGLGLGRLHMKLIHEEWRA